MEYIIFFVVVLIAIMIFFVKGIFDNRTYKKEFIEKLKRNYGTIPQKEYKSEQYENISHFYQKHREPFSIDDITWNDLEMDRLFQMMNHTYSSAGEEYLYYTLRTPKMKLDQLLKTETLVQHFDKEEDDRVKVQLVMNNLGKTGKYSLYDYLDRLDLLGERSNVKQHILNGLFLPALCFIYVNTAIGVISLVALICYNIISYFKDKSVIEPYITSFAYVMRLLNGVDEISKLKIPVLQEYQEELVARRKKFNHFKRNSYLIMSGARMTGNPLELILDYVRMTFHLDIIKFNSMLHALRQRTVDIDVCVQIMGEIETAIAIGSFRASVPYTCIPEFKDHIDANQVYHPYIKNPVANSICVTKGVLLTGSNASGKSTFLKTIAINTLMAQTIYTTTAKSFLTCFYRLYSSMSLRDDMGSGESYYMVEIKSLKRILDAVLQEKEEKVLCFVDEVLRGTNTVERIAASTQILKSLIQNKVDCFAATHDVELTTLLKEEYDNYHFTEEVMDGDVVFHYQLLEGSASTRNAIQLLSMIGYQDEIIDAANKMAVSFSSTGRWE